MSMTQDGNTFTAELTIDGVTDDLHVIRFEGQEALNTQFCLRVLFACATPRLWDTVKCGYGACLTLKGSGGERHFDGEVARFQTRDSRRAADWNATFYRLTLVPRAHRLKLGANCRIFQKQTAEQIVTKVLQEHGVSARFKNKGGKPPLEREYCVQYRESDWNLVKRLLEDEGYFYFFEHEKEAHTLRVGNDYQHHEEIAGDATLDFHPPDSRTTQAEHVYSWHYDEAMRVGMVELRDYNYEKPNLDMTASAGDVEGSPDAHGTFYDYPGKYSTPEQGEEIAHTMGNSFVDKLETWYYAGQSTCPRLTPGYTFVTGEFPDEEDQGLEMLIVRVEHRGESSAPDVGEGGLAQALSYSNSFACSPRGEDSYCPPRVTPRPRVHGVQTAVVQGKGQEVDMDEQGRVHVKFHWDRRQPGATDLTCKVRVAQSWAGQAWGAQFTPRAGHEVVVDFIEGDPDRPLITGSVYNAVNPPPYPRDATKSTIKSNSSPGGDGYNELRFEDKKGDEEFFTHAQKNQNEVVEENLSTKVGGNQGLSVGGNRGVGVGNNESVKIGANQTIKVGGDRATTVEGAASLTVTGGDRTVGVSANYKSKSGASTDIKAGTAIFMKAPYIKADARDVEINGSATIHETSREVKIVGSSQVDVSGAFIAVAGKTVVIQGGSVRVEGNTIEVAGKTVNVSGLTVNVEGRGDVNINGTVTTVTGGPLKLNC